MINNFRPDTSLIAKILIVLSILYGLHLRLAATEYTEVNNPIRADAKDYYIYSMNLNFYNIFSRSTENVTPDALRSPGFPYFASFFLEKKYPSLQNTLRAQTVFQTFTFLIVTYILIKSFGVGIAVVPTFILWTFPHFITINTYFLTESLFTSVLTVSICLLFLLEKYPGNKIVLITSGILLGISSLIRPSTEYFPFFILLISLMFFRPQLKSASIYAIGALIPIALWKLRNYFALGSISDPTLMINALYHGSFPNFMYDNRPETFGFPYSYDPKSNEVYEGIGATLSIIWSRVIESPILYLKWYLIGKLEYFWQWSIVSGQGDIFIYPVDKSPYMSLPDMALTRQLNYLAHKFWIVLGLAFSIFYCFRTVLKKDPIFTFWVMSAFIVFYASLLNIITAPFPRYGIPFKVMLIPLTTLGIYSLYSEIKKWAQNQPQ